MAKRVHIARDGKLRGDGKKCCVVLDSGSQLNLLKIAVKERKSMSNILRELINQAVNEGRLANEGRD